NEDHYREGKSRFGPLAVVCDGMGGHAGGKEASALASATVFEEVDAAPEGESPAGALKRAIEIANRKVYALGQSGMHGRPGSTIVALLFHKAGAEVAHVGDSRIYLVRGVECMQITRDHSAVQLMVDAGVLTPEQAKVHPEANKITRALGIEAEVDVEVRPHPFPYAPGDTFVLCSDGLSDLLDPDDFVRLVGGVPLAQAAGQLVDLANARGGHDNITALLVRAKGGAHASTEHRTQLMPAAGGGASGGVAKTLIGAPIAAPGRAALSPTMVMEPNASGPGASGAHSAHVPSAPRSAPRPRSGNPSLVIGLVLAMLVVGILGTLLYFELRERGGRHHERTAPMPSVVV
ncbi:MAG: serine/threonine-protein phosphatase, partial [Proteobacteria bacterium]